MNGQQFRLVNEMVRGNAIRALQLAEIGGDEIMVVRIEPEEKKRTQRQNKYLWGVVYKYLVDNDPGYFVNEETERLLHVRGIAMNEIVHEFCKAQFLPPVDLGIGGGLRITKSTAKLNRQEFNDYVENIRRWAAEALQVFIPDPYACGYEDLVGRG
uniref:Protein NinB n=1 Tax=Myoviridae sp. ctRci5 TaxID=2825105 RepID=A0A8S5V6S2_9CAUD|nr:MAG TPA: protein NinB [Myoviridae sp. ctRci5]